MIWLPPCSRVAKSSATLFARDRAYASPPAFSACASKACVRFLRPGINAQGKRALRRPRKHQPLAKACSKRRSSVLRECTFCAPYRPQQAPGMSQQDSSWHTDSDTSAWYRATGHTRRFRGLRSYDAIASGSRSQRHRGRSQGQGAMCTAYSQRVRWTLLERWVQLAMDSGHRCACEAQFRALERALAGTARGTNQHSVLLPPQASAVLHKCFTAHDCTGHNFVPHHAHARGMRDAKIRA